MGNGSTLFRIILQISDLDKAAEFYSKLLADEGRRIPRGSRHYFDCGSVILALVDVSVGGEAAKPIPDYVYFAVSNLEEVYARARELNCLSTEDVHGASAGKIAKRLWGELSFYVEDPWGNGLCFVDETTLFAGAEKTVPESFKAYEDGKHRRYQLLFTVNGGAFAVAKLFVGKDASNVLGSLTLRQLAIAMVLFTVVMSTDIFMFGKKMRDTYLPDAFSWQGKLVLILLGLIICVGWGLVAR